MCVTLVEGVALMLLFAGVAIARLALGASSRDEPGIP